MRKVLKWLLYWQWKRSLTRGERVRLYYWGATGNPKHHPYSWAD